MGPHQKLDLPGGGGLVDGWDYCEDVFTHSLAQGTLLKGLVEHVLILKKDNFVLGIYLEKFMSDLSLLACLEWMSEFVVLFCVGLGSHLVSSGFTFMLFHLFM